MLERSELTILRRPWSLRARLCCHGLKWTWLVLVMVAVAVRLPLALETSYLSPDAVEYMDIARHLAAGQGFTLSIKGYFVDSSAVVHNGLTERPPLYALVLTPLAALPGWSRSPALLNTALAGLNVAL